jgi:hypothetical protein
MRDIMSPLDGITSPLRRRSGGGFSPSALFSSGEQGAWYDPSDFSTMFQDSAGTTPVTAVEQPVGKILDKSGRGNHASQSTESSRPVLSARYNLMSYSEDFRNTATAGSTRPWFYGTATVTANAYSAPDGTQTADKLVEDNTFGSHSLRQTVTVGSGVAYTLRVCARAKERSQIMIQYFDGSTNKYPVFSLLDGSKVSDNGIGTSYSATPLDDDWWEFKLFITSAGTSAQCYFYSAVSGSNAYTGDNSSGLYIWGADLRPTNDGVGLPSYQRVVTGTTADYNTTGFPAYLLVDGTDDSLATGSIDFSATDKMSVFAGVRKLNDNFGVYTELGPVVNTTDGTFWLGPYSGYGLGARGTVYANALISPTAAPRTDVLTGTSSIAGDLARLRINSVLAAETTGDQGTGNYASFPLHIGRRNGDAFPAFFRLYSLIVRGALSTDAQIASTETWVNGKTAAY